MGVSDFLTDLFRYVKQQSKGISIERLLIVWFISIIIIHLIFMIYVKVKGNKYSWKKELWWILMIGYVCFGCHITLLRRAAGTRGDIYTDLNIGSLSGGFYSRQQFFYSLLNVLLFVPWGCLWGIYRWKDSCLRRIFMVISYSFLTSFTIEMLQLLTGRGFFELSDFIMNVSGGLIGSVIASFIISAAERVREEKGNEGK